MPKTVTITGFVHEQDYGDGEKVYRFWPAEMSDRYNTVVGPAAFTYDIPDDWDPRPAKIAALEELRRKVRAEFAAKITEIEGEISKLLSLEMAEA